MHTNNNTNLLGIKDLEVINVNENIGSITIECNHIHKRICLYCGSSNNWVHDHRLQDIKDSPMRKKKIILRVKKTRYNCKSCGKRFEIPLSFVAKRRQITKRLVEYVCASYRGIRSVSEVSKEIGISSSTFLRIINCINITRKTLPKVFCIDEFKGDSVNSKYQTTIADGQNRVLIDILPSRCIGHLKT